jgi:hypothetical protein
VSGGGKCFHRCRGWAIKPGWVGKKSPTEDCVATLIGGRNGWVGRGTPCLGGPIRKKGEMKQFEIDADHDRRAAALHERY